MYLFLFTEHHHVHFDETATLKDEFETENSVTYQKSAKNIIIVHLGFLQINHRYLIDLKLPANLFNGTQEMILAPDNNADTNIHCKLVNCSFNKGDVDDGKSDSNNFNSNSSSSTNFNNTTDVYDMKIEYFAHKEKLLKEELKLVNSENLEELLKLVVTARVLGKGKGTPMLRNGIHCVGSEDSADGDDDSDVSDTASSSTIN